MLPGVPVFAMNTFPIALIAPGLGCKQHAAIDKVHEPNAESIQS
jgi:hypothetical protein